MARKRFVPGDVLEVRTPSGVRGTVRVLRLDKFGLLLQLSRKNGVFISSDRNRIVYVNPYSVTSWTKVGESAIDEVLENVPTFFFGDSTYGWTLRSNEGESHVDGVSMSELRRRGYVDEVLWLAKDIEGWIESGKPPVWPFEL